MKVDQDGKGGKVIALEENEVDLLRLTLERATFVDTPPERQVEILRFAEDLLKGIAK